ncbi:uncharacterized protein F4817DRAFT_364536 [Daldinia loculata]|uniref:uncharacterized protein n=1 Tax=Daldinia loculata TaxID=103429 RepID=UPI0020C358DC|nr:uncharacterized protein F4817DRAFT_364536 [Daldinia loculata]KAI1648126.1 hypothetical protein F4817DRAFT_364536 [Daldinia loculata]
MPPKKSDPSSKGKRTAVRKTAPPGRGARKRNGPTAAEKRAEKAAEKAAEKEAARAREECRLRREAEKVELPTHPDDDLLVLSMTQRTNRKRSANMAYDDCDRSKRPKIFEDGGKKKVSRLLPWEKDKRLEQPPSLDTLKLESLTSVEAMGTLGRLPTEIRDEILRYILISPRDIAVFRGWTRVYGRRGPKLDLAILYTCRVLWLEGLRILFGENTFLYDIRDPPDYLEMTERIMGRVFLKDKIPIDKYGHLMRYIKINVPANRLNSTVISNFCNAIRKFVPGHGLAEPAHLHTLTLKIPAVQVRDMGFTDLVEDPNEVPATRLFNHFTTTRESLMLLNVQYLRILATDSDANLYENVINLRCHYMQKQAREDKNGVAVKDAEGAEAYFKKQVKSAKSRVYMLKMAIEMLAVLCPEERDSMKSEPWKFLGQEKRGRHIDSMEVETLPDDWSEASEPASSRGSRSPSVRPEYTQEQLARLISEDDESETSDDSDQGIVSSE